MHESERRPIRSQLPAEALSVDQVTTRYAGKWVLLRVTSFDEDRLPAHGYVVAYGPEKRMHTALQHLLSKGREGPYYFFCAYPRLRTGQELRQALAEAAEQGDLGARGPW